jgi:hypothetical protein
LNNVDVVLIDRMVSIGALYAHFFIISLCNILIGVCMKRHTSCHSHVASIVGILTVIIQNLATFDWALEMILVIEERLPTVADEFWSYCLIVSDLVGELLFVIIQIS